MQSKPSPTAHLIHGFVGSGKTFFAKKLEKELNAARFSPDEWMISRHGNNPPAEQYAELEKEIVQEIKQAAQRLLSENKDVILDFGFWTRKGRDEIREWVKSTGAAAKFYSITCPEEIMRERVKQRSMNHSELMIDEAAFDLFKNRFEPMQDDESCEMIVTG